ncbi:hypothetical protein [Bacteroides thetaiotaomicron]|uniref:hypothetical protein n=1 Tax=Bacteroides thetaiotaomicron TaxID=818 RepID=UPI0039C3E204
MNIFFSKVRSLLFLPIESVGFQSPYTDIPPPAISREGALRNTILYLLTQSLTISQWSSKHFQCIFTYDEIFSSLICCLNLYADANIQKDNK